MDIQDTRRLHLLFRNMGFHLHLSNSSDFYFISQNRYFTNIWVYGNWIKLCLARSYKKNKIMIKVKDKTLQRISDQPILMERRIYFIGILIYIHLKESRA
jgi:hypothetical protein